MNKQKYRLQAFGLEVLNTVRYFPGVAAVASANEVPPSKNNYTIDKSTITQDTPLYIGSLGTPVFADLDISNGSYVDNQGRTVDYPGIVIDAVLMDVNRPNIIVKDQPQGLNGTIKEFISADDWQINVKGVLIGGNNIYPTKAVNDLYTVLSAQLELQVNSWFLSQFGISHMIITGFKFPQTAGYYGQQLFEFSAISDIPVNIQLGS